MNWSRRSVLPSGIRSRWKTTASLVSPSACTGRVSPRTRAPAGIRTCWPLCENTGFVTRQFTGDAPLPSSLFVRTVSITVPSRIRCRGPAASIGPVRSGLRSVDSRASGDRAICGGFASFAPAVLPGETPLFPPVARTTAWAISSSEGVRLSLGSIAAPAMPAGRPESGRSASGRRLRTTLLANRLSYSRRLRSASNGSSGAGRGGSSSRGASVTTGCIA